MKNPFKKSNIVSTAVNVALGGGANVAMNYAFDNLDFLDSVKAYKNYIKLGLGILGGTLTSNKYLRPALDGIATVGASEVIDELISSTTGASGLADGTIGRARRMRLGQRGFRNARRVAGVAGSNFMGC